MKKGDYIIKWCLVWLRVTMRRKGSLYIKNRVHGFVIWEWFSHMCGVTIPLIMVTIFSKRN